MRERGIARHESSTEVCALRARLVTLPFVFGFNCDDRAFLNYFFLGIIGFVQGIYGSIVERSIFPSNEIRI